MSTFQVVRIPPYKFIHVLDTNTNVTRVLNGPKTYTKQDHEKVTMGPEDMVTVPPRHYCEVANPVILGDDGTPELDRYGQFKLRFGDSEIRMVDQYPEPFPLYPGESLATAVTPLKVVMQNTCLVLQAVRPFAEEDGTRREAGDEWHFHGPGTFIPRVEVREMKLLRATIVNTGQALRIRARRKCVDRDAVTRQAGEEWLLRTPGAFLPGPDEEVLGTVNATILTDRKALHLTATRDFVDVYGTKRRAGEEWLVRHTLATSHIIDVYERLVTEVPLTTLSNREYCVVLDPYVDGEQRLGTKELRVGEASFFLQPGEKLAHDIQSVVVLADDEALLLSAGEAFTDKDYVGHDGGEPSDVHRAPGDRWMVYGPCEYVPPVMVEVLERRKAIPLDENEGVYVQNNRTGAVSAVMGSTYMLKPTESLWAKELTPEIEDLLSKQAHGQSYVVPAHHPGKGRGRAGAGAGAGWEEETHSGRDKCRVVAFRVAHNSACQVYDYRARTSRVVFGPDLVMLGPEEEFTVVRLSGDKPKRPNVICSLTLMLGPDFMTDVVTVETADHARLNLTLSYNWHFEVDPEEDDANRIFNVRDFVGDACKAIASRVRGAVAAESFDNFHKYSAKIIRSSVFGLTEDNRVKDRLVFKANSLVITNVDVQSVEPVDERTRESLVKSVQLAIEITTNSQEARAHHEAKREEEEAKGLLERQQLKNEADAEAQRKHLLQLRAESAAVETQGQAKAEAEALAQAAQIKGEADVTQAQLRAKAMSIESSAALEQLQAKHREEIAHLRALNELELAKSREMAEIEAKKFADTVEAIGADTIAAIARAGPEMQAKLLQGLGLKGFLVTDGHNPINLFQTAQGMVAPGGFAGAAGGAGAGAPAGALSDAGSVL